MKNKSWIIWLGIIILMGLGFNKILFPHGPKLYEMKIGQANIKYELAKTDKEVELGLSYRKSIPQGQGMLFVFPKKGFRTFWMQEMLFPLDMVWIADEKIVQIDKNIPIKTNGAWTVVNADFPADKVLELTGGEADRMGINAGEKVLF